MPPFETLLGFIAAGAIFAYMPGPAMLYTAAQTIARGKKAGWMAILGMHLGGYVHVLAAAAGLAILFKTIPTLYLVLKIVGAGYLILLGIKMFRSPSSSEAATQLIPTKSARRAFLESVTVEIANPKTAIFYLAFLPQFIDTAATFPVWLQVFILGTIVNLMFTSADAVCVLVAHRVTQTFKGSQSFSGILKKAGGSILIALGINLATSRS